MSVRFRGTGVALVTPFHKQGVIDFGSLEALIEHTIKGGVDYLVVLGTTAEAATLSKEEKRAIKEFVVEIVNKRVLLVVGEGGYNTQEIVNNLKTCSFEGFDAILSVTPYYNRPQQRGLYLHYKTVAAASPLPIILYNVPGRTSVNMRAETTLQLASEFNNIIGIKEASANMEQIMDIIRRKPKDFLVISGDDMLALPLINMGADGVISVVGNAYPRELSDMVNFGLKGELKKAREIHYRMTEVVKSLFIDGNPSGIKAALEIKGIISNNLRLPLVKVEKAVYNHIANMIQEFEG
jgi:4-hydroxy-tetrahydrodipicolinate synthase